MKNIVITSGKKYIDIDGYASCTSYRELLRSNGFNAYAVTNAPFNESVPPLILSIPYSFDKYIPEYNDEFIVLDISNPLMFEEFVNKNNIIEIIDHHTGYEDLWKENNNVFIEFIGSIATIIYEKFVSNKKTNLLNTDLCKLLVAAILDNTLDLKASITTDRDKKAFNELMKIGNINTSFSEEYFNDCDKYIYSDIKGSILNDIKNAKANKNLPSVFGQVLIYDKTILFNNLNIIEEVFSTYSTWIMNIISLKDGKSYILADTSSKKTLETIFNKKFDKDILTLDKFMLRKEIIKLASEIEI